MGTSRSDKSSTKVSKMVNRMLAHKITAAEKDEKNPDSGKREEKAENGFTKPRRNKVSKLKSTGYQDFITLWKDLWSSYHVV